MIRAAITIGSNSTRMLCASVADGQVSPIRIGRAETRLFLGLDENGDLTPQAITGCVAAVLRLKAEAVLCGAEGPVRVYATSATRDAKNQTVFLKALEDAGCPAMVLSGQEEAALAFRAAADGEDAMVTDIGGGSTELIRGRQGRIESSVSLQLGASRLYRYRPINSPEDLDAVRGVIKRVLDKNGSMFSGTPAGTLFGIGGTLTSLAAILLKVPFLGKDAGKRKTACDGHPARTDPVYRSRAGHPGTDLPEGEL